MVTPLDEVKRLNYDHHRRMQELHDSRIRTGENVSIAAIDDLSYRTLLALVPRRYRILELGSSSGDQWPLLRNEWLLPTGTITGIDLYEPRVRIARSHNLSIYLGFVEDMHMFLDNSFDLVCSRHVMEHLGDLPRGMAEIMRVTAPGGYVAHATPDLAVDDEPAHLNRLSLAQWTQLWDHVGLQVLDSQRHTYHGGEVHVMGVK